MSRQARAMLAAALTTWLGSPDAHAQEDRWFGRDKALHFGVSVALGATGYALATPIFDERWQRASAAGAFALSFGAAKELYDASSGGDASWKDFSWDVAGSAVGVGIALLIDLTLAPKRTSEASVRRRVLACAPWHCSTAKYAW